MKSFALLPLVLVATVSTCFGHDGSVARNYTPAVEQFTYSWVSMPLLPRRFQNHCGYVDGHYVCADHCGVDYQIYACTPASSGCCHIGHGYCDGNGQLRCSPPLF